MFPLRPILGQNQNQGFPDDQWAQAGAEGLAAPAPPVAQGLVAPQQVGPVFSQQQNPYAWLSGGRESVLSTDPAQAKLAQAHDQLLQSVIDGNSPKQRALQEIPKIFGGAAAVLGGIMGGGNAQAGLQLIQDTEQQTQQARVERMQRQKDAISGMSAIANIVSATSPYSQKNLAAASNVAVKQQNAQTNAFNAQTKSLKAIDIKAIRERQAAEVERHNKIGEQLRAFGLKKEYDQMANIAEMQKARLGVAVQIEVIRQAAEQGRFDQSMKVKLAELVSAEKVINAKLAEAAGQFDAEMALKSQQHDKDGNLVYQGAVIPKMAGLVNVASDYSNLLESDADTDATAAYQRVMQAISQPAVPQAPAALTQMMPQAPAPARQPAAPTPAPAQPAAPPVEKPKPSIPNWKKKSPAGMVSAPPNTQSGSTAQLWQAQKPEQQSASFMAMVQMAKQRGLTDADAVNYVKQKLGRR